MKKPSGANRAGFTMRGSPTFHPVREWTALEDRYLKLQWEAGVHDALIAAKLQRTIKSIRSRADRKGWQRGRRGKRAA